MRGVRVKKVGFGIQSTAKIGRTKVTPAYSTRNCAGGHRFAHLGVLSIPTAYDSHEKLPVAPDIDAVDIPRPSISTSSGP